MDPITLALITSAVTGIAGAGANKLMNSGNGSGHHQRSRLHPSQQKLYDQLQKSLLEPGAGGAFGSAADYYRDLLSDDSQTANAMFKPEMRRFNEEIIPGLSEQFAGMGSGGLSSSGFRNATVNAGTDLSERLGAIRAGLRAQGAQGLANLGVIGLGDYTNNYYQQDAPGFFESVAPGVAQAGTQAAFDYFKDKPATPQTPPVAPVQASALSSRLPDFNYKGKSSPYGNYQMGGGGYQRNFQLGGQ